MAMVPIKALGILLLGGALCASADDAGKAAAKAYSRAGKPADARTPSKTPAPSPVSAMAQAALPGPGRMQVEEPAAVASASEARASRAWQKNHAKGLTDAQRAAFRERKDKMEGMIALIKAKRKALRDAKPDERAALARELHSLILERDAAPATVAATVRMENLEAAGKEAESAAEAGAAEARDNAEAKSLRREEIRARQLERLMQRKSKEEE